MMEPGINLTYSGVGEFEMKTADVFSMPPAGDSPARSSRAGVVRRGGAPGTRAGAGREQRRHERVTAGNALVAVEGTLYPVHNVSIGGFRLAGYEGGLGVGDGFDFVFHLAMDGRATACAGRGQVRRRDAAGLGAAFVMEDPAFYAVLCRFIEQERSLQISYGDARAPAAPRPAFVREVI